MMLPARLSPFDRRALQNPEIMLTHLSERLDGGCPRRRFRRRPGDRDRDRLACCKGLAQLCRRVGSRLRGWGLTGSHFRTMPIQTRPLNSRSSRACSQVTSFRLFISSSDRISNHVIRSDKSRSTVLDPRGLGSRLKNPAKLRHVAASL